MAVNFFVLRMYGELVADKKGTQVGGTSCQFTLRQGLYRNVEQVKEVMRHPPGDLIGIVQ
jgi:hypothetical protein